MDPPVSTDNSNFDDHRIWTANGWIHARRWPSVSSTSHAPIVLLHDSLGSVALWRSFLEELAEATSRTVIAYDRLGFGRSDPHPATLGFDFIQGESSGDFADVLARFALKDFLVMGHSVGGGMALGIAAAHSGRCKGVIAESAQTFVEDVTLDGIGAAKLAFATPDQRTRLEKYHGAKANWVLDAWTETWLAAGFANWSLDRTLRCVRCPVFVVRGIADEYGSGLHAIRIQDFVRASVTIEQLANVGHVPHKEAAPEVLRLISAFTRTIDY